MARSYFKCAACGESVRVDGRNRKTADWLAEQREAEGALCDSCQRKQFDADNAEAAEKNAAAGLPPLTGSEKQVAWAETIRAERLELLRKIRDGELSALELGCYWDPTMDVDDPAIPAVEEALRNRTKASWWIDHRQDRMSSLLETVATEMPAPETVAAPEGEDIAAAALAEATVRPEQEITATIAEIRPEGERIEVLFPEKREDVRQLLCFELGYKWSGTVWERKITALSGPLADRAVEAGNRLLALGIPIRLFDDTLRARAVAADFAPECKRWISAYAKGEHQGKIYISWPREADLYSAAKALPGARYDKPGIAVDPRHYDAIEDFAEANGFSITAKARALLAAARIAHDAALVARPASPTPENLPDGSSMPPATGEIDADLADD